MRVFVDPIVPAPQLVVIGAVHIAIPLMTMAVAAGFIVSVVDPRTAFNNAERIPNAERLVTAWPDEALPRLRPRTARRRGVPRPRSEVRGPGAHRAAPHRDRLHRRDRQPRHARQAGGAAARGGIHRHRHRADPQPGRAQSRRRDARGDRRSRSSRRSSRCAGAGTRGRCRRCPAAAAPGEAGGPPRLSGRRPSGALDRGRCSAATSSARTAARC